MTDKCSYGATAEGLEINFKLQFHLLKIMDIFFHTHNIKYAHKFQLHCEASRHNVSSKHNLLYKNIGTCIRKSSVQANFKKSTPGPSITSNVLPFHPSKHIKTTPYDVLMVDLFLSCFI